jgi:hypothetical protein
MVERMHEPAAPAAADFATGLEQLRTGRADPAMRDVFALAKTMTGMPLGDVRLLLASDEHLHRVGAVSVLDFRARRRRVTDEERAALYELYVGEHDLINTWDLVDRAAPRVVGGYLDRQVPGLPKTILTHAVRHLPEDVRQRYRDLNRSA